MDNKQVAAVLSETAMFLQLAGDEVLRAQAFSACARAIEHLQEDVSVLVRAKSLRMVRDVGEEFEAGIAELLLSGRLELLERLRAKFPPTIFELLNIAGLGPARVKLLYETLGVDSLDKLRAACEGDKVSGLRGFGKIMQNKLLDEIEYAKRYKGRYLLNKAGAAAQKLIDFLSKDYSIIRIELAGSLRRRMELIKNINIVASSINPSLVQRNLLAAPGVVEVSAESARTFRATLPDGIVALVNVVDDVQYPFALLYCTGSTEHFNVLRGRAAKLGFQLDAYGLYDGEGKLLPCTMEEDIYERLKLPFIAPELRENIGEFFTERLPKNLVKRTDLKGLIHCHTTYSDGNNTLEEMAQASRDRGYSYMIVSDHSQSAGYANGMKPARVVQQHREIEALNESMTDFRILKGIESDILPDGSLDYDKGLLESFDVIIASIHSHLNMTEQEATARLVRAIEHPLTNILGHLTGRLLMLRKGYPVDMAKILDACSANQVAIEINANCRRLDIDWRYLRYGKEKGIKFAVAPDAHRVEGLDLVVYGLGMARKGWLEPCDLLNAMSADDVLAWCKKKQKK